MTNADLHIEGSDSEGNYFEASWGNLTDAQLAQATNILEKLLGKADTVA